jgi:hypothetical protein
VSRPSLAVTAIDIAARVQSAAPVQPARTARFSIAIAIAIGAAVAIFLGRELYRVVVESPPQAAVGSALERDRLPDPHRRGDL